MRIAVAQTRPVKGDILRNVEVHIRHIELAAEERVGMIIFPELSITGYEPELAAGLAGGVEDVRLEVFQTLSERYSMTVGVGFPTRAATEVRITMILFQPGMPRLAYSKRYLHADEEPYFVGGEEEVSLEGRRIALAICYELSVPAHAEQARSGGAEVYLVSAAKTRAGMEKAGETLAEIARRYQMTVLISNCVGRCDNFDAGGGSAVWDKEGKKLAQLDEEEQGILVLDTENGEVVRLDMGRGGD